MDRDEEFTAFVREASPSLSRTAWLLVGNRDGAADLVQAALVKTYLAWGRVDRSTATAYARRAMVNDNPRTCCASSCTPPRTPSRSRSTNGRCSPRGAAPARPAPCAGWC